MPKILIGCCLLWLSALLQASSYTELSAIQLEAKHWSEKNLAEQFGNTIVVQLKSANTTVSTRCLAPLSFFLLHTKLQNDMTVGVRCESQTVEGWTIFIPIFVQLKKQVVIAVRDLPPGVAVQAQDVILQERDSIPLRHGYFEKIEAVLGQTTEVAVTIGTPLTPHALHPTTIIKRGLSIRVIAQNVREYYDDD